MMANTYEFEMTDVSVGDNRGRVQKTQGSGHVEVDVTCEDPLEYHIPQVHSGDIPPIKVIENVLETEYH